MDETGESSVLLVVRFLLGSLLSLYVSGPGRLSFDAMGADENREKSAPRL